METRTLQLIETDEIGIETMALQSQKDKKKHSAGIISIHYIVDAPYRFMLDYKPT